MQNDANYQHLRGQLGPRVGHIMFLDPIKNHENPPRIMKNQPGTMKNNENRPRTMKTDQEPRKTNQEP